MNIQKSTREFEQWLALYTEIVPADITYKHEQMKTGAFPFLRATFYRWAQEWTKINADVAKAPIVLAVGDLHVENFGTWRDAEGRLIWGVNDFDEAGHMPYTSDLVRLATSAHLAIQDKHLCVECVQAGEAILNGYVAGLKAGGQPFVLAEEHPELSGIAGASLRNPAAYWKKLDDLPREKGPVLESAIVALEEALPDKGLPYTLKRRVAGLGNLGKPRYVALAKMNGGHIAREVKALVPSASVWAQGSFETAPEIFYQAIVGRSVRSPDPFVRLSGHWIVRRLGPDCSRIEISSLGDERAEMRLLHSMGWETANIHLGSRASIDAIRKDLKSRKAGWLSAAAEQMVRATEADWTQWASG